MNLNTITKLLVGYLPALATKGELIYAFVMIGISLAILITQFILCHIYFICPTHRAKKEAENEEKKRVMIIVRDVLQYRIDTLNLLKKLECPGSSDIKITNLLDSYTKAVKLLNYRLKNYNYKIPKWITDLVKDAFVYQALLEASDEAPATEAEPEPETEPTTAEESSVVAKRKAAPKGKGGRK